MATSEPVPAALQILRSRPLFTMHVTVSKLHVPGGPAGAERRIGDIPGGTFAGDRLSGIILTGGTDWQTVRSDGAVLLDARILLQTGDGAMIAMTYTGIRHGPPEVLARMARGEEVDPSSYYFRIVPSFTTSSPRYEWLNRIVSVGLGHRLAGGPVYSLFEIL